MYGLSEYLNSLEEVTPSVDVEATPVVSSCPPPSAPAKPTVAQVLQRWCVTVDGTPSDAMPAKSRPCYVCAHKDRASLKTKSGPSLCVGCILVLDKEMEAVRA